MRKRVFFSVIVLCFGIIISGNLRVFASHSMGADLTYRCLGGNSYEILLSFYRDCLGVQADDSAMIDFSSSCFPGGSLYLQRIPGTGQEITTICPSETTTCSGGQYTGIQEYVFRGYLTLPGPCTDWTFSYNLCCRNYAITNINNPGSSQLYIYATLDNTVVTCNNSPTFSNKPVPFVCQGQQFCYNHGAYDVDGDSLAYTLITPYDSPGNPINYLFPYSASNPLTSNPAVSFNPFTGDICMTPQNLEVTVMAVLVQEYRNGVLIGSVERDIQVTVQTCSNQLPAMTGINGTNQFSQTVCAGVQSCFTIYSTDVNSSQDTYVSWDYSIPGAASFTVTPGHRESAVFCWTPTFAQISPNPYCFTVSVHDDACPYFGNQVFSYCITVTGIQANAGPDQLVGCNTYATLSATATGGSSSYTWLWNNGATTQSITSGPGTYAVTANDGMCTRSDTVLVLPDAGVASAAFSFVNSCSIPLVTFTDQTLITGGVIASWHWEFGDGDTSDLQNPAHTYALLGNYTVLLVVQTAGGCIDSVLQNVNLVNHQPVAAFTSPDVCVNATMNFTNQSTSPTAITSFHWDFGDGFTSIQTSPSHTYTSPGTFPVTLIIFNASGCSDTLFQNALVYPSPPANAGNDTSICIGGTAQLTATGGASYSWMPGGSSFQSITVSPMTNQVYTVTVTDNNLCQATDMVMVTVNPNPFANAGPDQEICSGYPVLLSATGGAGYSWNPGDVNTQEYLVTPSVTTSYIVTVTDGNGCNSMDTVTIAVNPSPVANAGNDQSVCFGSLVNLTGTGGLSNLWLPSGDTVAAITINPAASAIYTFIVFYPTGCSDTDEVEITVNPLPVAQIDIPQLVCRNSSAQFYNLSTISSGVISSINWNFGNGGSSLADTPVVSYVDTGSYIVTLIVTSDEGCRDTTASTIVVAPLPEVAFTSSDVCFPDPVSFTNLSVISSGEPVDYHWDFGDGQTSDVFSPQHAYSEYGSYTTSLLAVSSNGCSDSSSQLRNVHPLPVAAFSTEPVCENTPLGFTDASVIPSGHIQTWHWNFGDGNESVSANPSHSWIMAGMYLVELKVTSNFGCRDSIVHDQRIFPNPVVIFTGESLCLHDTVHFINLTTISSGEVVDWIWAFGDNNFSNEPAPEHLYTNVQSYTVELTAVSDSGCTITSTMPAAVTIFPLPVAGFVPGAVELDSDYPYVDFENQSIHADFYFWDFGDGNFSNDVSPGHSYADTGIYEIQLIVMDLNGCLDTTLSSVEVKPVVSLFIPDAFSPNGDGKNDTFRPFFMNMSMVRVQVFDRWGVKVCDWDDPDGSWNGWYAGSQAPSDVYVWRLEYKDIYGKKSTRLGHVTLVR